MSKSSSQLSWMDTFPNRMWSHIENGNVAQITRIVKEEPEHAINFLRYVKRSYFGTGRFHNACPICGYVTNHKYSCPRSTFRAR